MSLQEQFAALSDRERQVLQLLFDGEKNQAVAHKLGMGERTVEYARSRIHRKLGVESFAHLIRKCCAAGFPNDQEQP